ncbi:interleukin-1 receptor-associated kinase 1 [Spatholobus suberectus]|nr:interleukin-1 receptor-associated kinase 1 [Spatholobus suberectus]
MVVLPSFSRYAQSTVAIVVIIFVLFHQTCSAKHRPSCPPSSCGKIRNITYPFRLKGDPRGCGLPRYELDCVNNVAVLTLFSGRYHVQDINYKRYQIRLTDAGVVEDTACSLPRYFLNGGNFSHLSIPYYSTPDPLTFRDSELESWGDYEYPSIGFLNCTNPVTDDPRYVEADTGRCNPGGHIYAVFRFSMMDTKVGCRLKVVTLADLIMNLTVREYGDDKITYIEYVNDTNASYADIQKWLNGGFRLYWLIPVICREQCGKDIRCYLNETTQQVQCDPHRLLPLRHHHQYELWTSTADS